MECPDGPTPVALEPRLSCRGPHARPRGDAACVRPRRRFTAGQQPGGCRGSRSGTRTAVSTAPPRELTWSGKVDMKLWSPVRVKAYKAALKQETPRTLAILRIPRLELEVPVYDGTTDAVLDLAAGRIEDTALPGTVGNVGIAAHRDGFFRVLKDIKEGDALELDTPVANEQYRVEWIRITIPTDVSVIDPTPGRAVTLVGCYPFYYQGSAPQRFIVRAVPAASSPAGS